MSGWGEMKCEVQAGGCRMEMIDCYVQDDGYGCICKTNKMNCRRTILL